MSTSFWISYAVLWILVAVLAIGVFALYQHFGQMYLTSRDGRQMQGPEQDRFLQPLSAATTTGEGIAIPPLARPSVLVFTETSCKLCGALRPEFGRFSTEQDDVDLIVVCGGPTHDSITAWASELPTEVDVIADVGMKFAIRYGIGITPFAVAVDADGVVRAKGLLNDYETLVVYAEVSNLSMSETVAAR